MQAIWIRKGPYMQITQRLDEHVYMHAGSRALTDAIYACCLSAPSIRSHSLAFKAAATTIESRVVSLEGLNIAPKLSVKFVPDAKGMH